MKQIKYIAILALATLLMGCANEYHSKFNDKWAFVAFEGNTFTVTDNKVSELKIPIYLSSETGLSSEVTVGVVAAETTAVADVHYVLTTKNFSFNATHNVDTVRIEILNIEDGFDSKVLKLDLVDISNTNLKTLTPREATITIREGK